MKTKLPPTLILILTLLVTGVSLRAEVDTGRPCGSTDYDKYLGPVRQTFAKFGGNTASVGEVRANLRTARWFRYYFNPAQPVQGGKTFEMSNVVDEFINTAKQ